MLTQAFFCLDTKEKKCIASSSCGLGSFAEAARKILLRKSHNQRMNHSGKDFRSRMNPAKKAFESKDGTFPVRIFGAARKPKIK